jgi:hypothetical protein
MTSSASINTDSLPDQAVFHTSSQQFVLPSDSLTGHDLYHEHQFLSTSSQPVNSRSLIHHISAAAAASDVSRHHQHPSSSTGDQLQRTSLKSLYSNSPASAAVSRRLIDTWTSSVQQQLQQEQQQQQREGGSINRYYWPVSVSDRISRPINSHSDTGMETELDDSSSTGDIWSSVKQILNDFETHGKDDLRRERNGSVHTKRTNGGKFVRIGRRTMDIVASDKLNRRHAKMTSPVIAGVKKRSLENRFVRIGRLFP